MFRALLYGSYKAPRELLWLFGMAIYLALMAEAFMGYVLPWGNMSFWGAQVIVNLFGTIPVIGPGLVEWIRGDYGIADATLNRFFSLHVVAVPLVLLLLVALHLVALRHNGSNNPDGIEIKEKLGPDGKPLDGIPFHPYYTVKDLVGVGVFLILFAVVVFFVPTFGGLFLEAPNFEPANPLSTPDAHRAGVVLHAVLRDPARRARPAAGRAADGARRWPSSCSCRGSTARRCKSTRYRPLRWKIWLAIVRGHVRRAGLSRPEAGRRALRARWRASSRCCTSRSSY